MSNELAGPTDKLSTLLSLVPPYDACLPRGRLITLLYIIRGCHEELA